MKVSNQQKTGNAGGNAASYCLAILQRLRLLNKPKLIAHKKTLKMRSGKLIKWAFMLMFMIGSASTFAQVTPIRGSVTPTQSVCVNATEPYVVADVASSTFTWSILSGTANVDWKMTSTGHNSIDVQWLVPGVYTVQLIETNSSNCAGNPVTVVVTVVPTNTVTAASSSPTVCIGTAMTNITHTTTGATGIGAPTGLPAGVSAAWAGNTITISGTPTASGTFNYTIPLTGGCGNVSATGTITVTANNTINLTSAVGTNAQTVCINTAITNITYATTGATGATFSGLPAGVTGAWAGNVATISGTPTTATGSPFSYTVTLTGGCGTVTTNGTITVNPDNTVTAASSSPTVCIGTAMTNITHTTTGATGIGAPTGLPAGVTAAWAGNTITISGTPTASGTFNYTIPLTGGCGNVSATGTITVTANNTINLTSAVGTNAQTVCINTAITNITYATTGATGATFSGLPAGVTGAWAGNVATISGTPTTATGSPFSYTVTLTGGCGTVTANGTITVNPLPVAPTGVNVDVCFDGAAHTGSATAGAGETIVWYTAATGGSVTSAPTGTAVGTYTAFAAAQNTTTGCESSTRTLVTVTIRPKPTTTPITHN